MPSDKKNISKSVSSEKKVYRSDTILKEKLQKLEQTAEQVPVDLKEDIFNVLDNVQLFADILDLFTVKFSQTKAQVIASVDNVISDIQGRNP